MMTQVGLDLLLMRGVSVSMERTYTGDFAESGLFIRSPSKDFFPLIGFLGFPEGEGG